MSTPEKNKNRFLTESSSFVLVVIGVAILLGSLLLFLFKTSSLSTDTTIDSSIFDHFGSLIGGLVGSIWSLAGFILFYVALTKQKESIDLQKDELKLQRSELKLQRDELKDTRKEFEIERITTLIFKQLERIDTIISFMPFDSPSGHPTPGIFGLRYLNTHFRGAYMDFGGVIPDVIQTINNQKEKITELFLVIETSRRVIEQQLYLTGLEDNDKRRLISIFAQNIDPEIYKLANKIDFFLSKFLNSSSLMPNKQIFIDSLNGILSDAKRINQLFESCNIDMSQA